MFNRTVNINAGRELFPYTKTVIEKKAPTDESIRLYGEIRGRAYSSILGTIELKDNIINANAVVFDDDAQMEKVLKYKFLINGKEVVGEVRSSTADLLNYEDFIGLVLKRLSEEIAKNLLLAFIEK